MIILKKVGVIGAGSWGTAMAILMAESARIYLWDIQQNLLDEIVRTGRNERYLPGIYLADNIEIESSLKRMVEQVELVVIAVPSHGFKPVLEKISDQLEEHRSCLVLTKGFDPESGLRLSELYLKQLGSLDNYYLLTGPSHATEVARRRPTTVTLGGGIEAQRKDLQEFLLRDYFRVYTNDDLIGLEMGGALKNIIALAAGVADGLGFGVNARAALITRGMNDLIEVARYEGADSQTLFGLSGMGDLIVTATSELSRNYQCGNYLAQGLSVEGAREKIGQVVEGINATKIVMGRVDRGGLRAPLFRMVSQVLEGKITPRDAVNRLMTREAGREFDFGNKE